MCGEGKGGIVAVEGNIIFKFKRKNHSEEHIRYSSVNLAQDSHQFGKKSYETDFQLKCSNPRSDCVDKSLCLSTHAHCIIEGEAPKIWFWSITHFLSRIKQKIQTQFTTEPISYKNGRIVK